MNKLFCYLLLLFANISFCQTNIITKIQESNLPINKKVDKLDSLLISIKNKDSLFILKNNYFHWLKKISLLEKSLSVGIELYKDSKRTIDSKKIQKLLFWIGYYYHSNNNNLFAVKYYTKSLDINDTNIVASNTYYQLGKTFKSINDYTNSTSYFKIAEQSLLSNKSNKVLLRNIFFQIANNSTFNQTVKRNKEGLKYGLKLDSISKTLKISNNDKIISKMLLASLYNNLISLNIEESLTQYNLALRYATKFKDTLRVDLINIHKGNLYNSTDYKKSFFFLNKVKQNNINDSVVLSKLFFNYALTYGFKKNHKKSIYNFKKSISYDIGTVIHPNFQILKINFKQSNELFHKLPLLANSYYLQYKKTKQIEYLKLSLDYYDLIDRIIDFIKVNNNFKSRLFWREVSSNIYNQAINICFLDNNIEKAFYYMEKNKHLLLMEDISNRNYRQTLNISKYLLEKENNYKKKMIQLETFNYKNKDSVNKLKLKLERKISLLQDSIYTENPLPLKIIIQSIQSVQNSLSKNQLFIEFHIPKNNTKTISFVDSKGYVIFITKENAFFFELNNLVELKENLTEYIALLKKPLRSKEEQSYFSIKSNTIYNSLFLTKKIKELIHGKELTIVPDGILSYLPFETLITEENSLNYLLYNTEINYKYSMSFQKVNNQHKRNVENNFLGIAPINFQYDSLTSLPKTKKEINIISNKFSNSKVAIKSKATKHFFLDLLNNYKIIHLATHADANNENSTWIAFKNEKMLLSEMYNTKTQAELIVLSACNTSLGKYEAGEGVMSLARGFFYSGAKSVVSSLWNVNDKSTTYLMSNFYANLKKGETKSKALHNAKINYLQNNQKTDASPYYWSSFILIGDASKIELIPDYSFYYIVSLFSLFLIVVILFKYKNRKSIFFG